MQFIEWKLNPMNSQKIDLSVEAVDGNVSKIFTSTVYSPSSQSQSVCLPLPVKRELEVCFIGDLTAIRKLDPKILEQIENEIREYYNDLTT